MAITMCFWHVWFIPSLPPASFSDHEQSMDKRDDVPDADTDLPDKDRDGEDLFDNNLLQEYIFQFNRERYCHLYNFLATMLPTRLDTY